MSPDLATALRTETPSAPETLRDRVALIAAAPPPPPRRRLALRRTLAWGAPAAAAAASLAVAVAVGIGTAIDPGLPAEEGGATTMLERQFSTADSAAESQSRARGPAPSSTRAQDVQANLELLVEDPADLSRATQQALRTTRRLGGYLVTVDYDTTQPDVGSAAIRVRIPVSRVQAAIVEFGELGQILSQRTQIADVQQRLDDLTRQIRGAKDKERADALRRERAALERRAAFATVVLGLTTHDPDAAAASPSRFDRALDEAVGVLKAELAVAAFLLIVASPFLVLLAAGYAGNRAYRRHADQRLMERA